MLNVNNFNKIRGIMRIACYCLFNTVLNELFHITDVYIFSTEKNNDPQHTLTNDTHQCISLQRVPLFFSKNVHDDKCEESN